MIVIFFCQRPTGTDRTEHIMQLSKTYLCVCDKRQYEHEIRHSGFPSQLEASPPPFQRVGWLSKDCSISGHSDRKQSRIKKKKMPHWWGGEMMKYDPGSPVGVIDLWVWSSWDNKAVYNIMRKDFTTVENYHGGNHWMEPSASRLVVSIYWPHSKWMRGQVFSCRADVGLNAACTETVVSLTISIITEKSPKKNRYQHDCH